MHKHIKDRRKGEWFVLRHLAPEYIDLQLKRVNQEREGNSRQGFLYIVPFQYMKRTKPDEGRDGTADRHDTLRHDFHDFVFIKATRKEIDRLLSEKWNQEGRLHLHYCRSYLGRPLRVNDAEMNILAQVFIDHHERFSLAPADPNLLLGLQVQLKEGIFNDQKVSVLQINYTGEGINLTLGLPMFNGTYTLKVKGSQVADIEVPDNMQRFFNPTPDLLKGIDNDLIDILRNRVKGHGPDNRTDRADDSEKLNTYYILNCLEFADTSRHRHLRTLMLLCASLRNDSRGVRMLAPVIESFLSSTRLASTDEEAFMMAVLFAATHKIAYRMAAKQYEQTHDTISEPLSSIMPVIKRIKVRKNEKRKNRRFDRIMAEQSKLTLRQIQDCDFRSLSPQAATAVGDILALDSWQWKDRQPLLQQLLETAESQYKDAVKTEEKMKWLEVMYRLSMACSPLNCTSALKKRCDELCDEQLAEGNTPSDTLLCYRIHTQREDYAPFEQTIHADLMNRCSQWLDDLSDVQPRLWHSLPLQERLYRLWTLAALDVWSKLESGEGTPHPHAWDDALECFERCHNQLLRLTDCDTDMLTVYYRTILLLYPDSNAFGAKDLYDEFFELVMKQYQSVCPNTKEWWQLKAMQEHHYKDRQLSPGRSKRSTIQK